MAKIDTAKIDTKIRHVTTGDIFEDLGFSPAEAELGRTKTLLHLEIMNTIKERGLTPRELERVLDVPQPRISELLNAKISKMTTDRLTKYLGMLGKSIHITTSDSATAEATAS